MLMIHHHEDVQIYSGDTFEVKEQKFLQAIEKHPEHKDEFYSQLHYLYLMNGQYDKALTSIQQAIETATLDGNRASYYHSLFTLYEGYLKGDNRLLAMSCMEKAVELEPNDEEYMHALARCYIEDKQYKKAITILTKILALPPNEYEESAEYEFFDNFDWLYTDENDHNFAKDVFNKMLEQAGNDEERCLAYMLLSYVAQDANDEVKATAYAKKAIELCPANYPAIMRLGDCYMYFQKYDKALKTYYKMLALAKNETSEFKNWRLRYCYETIGPLHLTMNNPDKAIACYEKMLPLYNSPTESYEALEQLAAIHYQHKQYDKAIPYLKKIIEIWPDAHPRAYTSIAAYYYNVEKEPENALNYMFMAAKANYQRDEHPGNDRELAVRINAFIGELYYKEFKDEEMAISFFEKALACGPDKEVEGQICDNLYKIYNDRGDEKNAAKYKERRSGLKIMLDLFSPEWQPPPPKTLKERLRNPKNKGANMEELPYHYSKLPDDIMQKEEILKPIVEDFEKDLLENPAYKEFFSKYTPESVQQFCKDYAQHKKLLVGGWEFYYDEPAREVAWKKYAHQMLELIMYKKLFNMQLLWRAGEISIPEIRVSHDFEFWGNDARHQILQCPFIEPITQGEVSVMKQFLADDSFSEHTRWLLCSWQDYEQIMKKDEDGDLTYMPDWYEFYDGMMGTGSLLLLPNIRGEKEEFYQNIYYEWIRRNPPPPVAPEPVTPILMNLFTWDGTAYTTFMEQFENDYLCRLHQGWLDEKKIPDESYSRETVQDAIFELEGADTPIYMEGGLIWHEAIIRCAQRFKNSKVSDRLDDAYADYLMKRELNLNSKVNVPNDLGTDLTKKVSEDMIERILKGRELNGEPRDLNF
jgi:tetratricopeptide (TPR) repeat protein